MTAKSDQKLDRVEEALIRAHRERAHPEPDDAWRRAVMRDIVEHGPHTKATHWVASGSTVLWPFAGVAASLAIASVVYFLATDQAIALDIADFYFDEPADYAMVQLVGL